MNDFDGALNKSLDDFMESYKTTDTEKIYSNGTEFVPIFRVKQWFEYNNQDKEIERLNKRIEDLNIINEEHQILNGMIRKELQQKENIIKEVREWAKKCSCQFTNDDGELVVSEINFNFQARPCDLFKILDKENKE